MPSIALETCGVSFGTSGVRGLVTDLTDSICYAYAQAFIGAIDKPAKMVIGHDLRPSSPQITQACAQACADLGIEVVYVGALPTPAIAYYAMQQGAPAIVVTGSHIPFDRNGIKFYRAEGEITKADEQAILAAAIQVPDDLLPAPLPLLDNRAETAYLRRYTEFFASDLCAGMRIAVYQHSGVGRDLLSELFTKLGAEVLTLGRSDSFVPIDTEAVRPEDIEQAQSWAKEHRFDLIVSTDGDADRPLIGDEKGDWLRGDVVGVLCARALGVDTVVTPVSSNTVLERSNWFSHTLRTRIGSPYVLAGMGEASGLVAGYEANGGFLLGSDIERESRLKALPTRDAVLPMLALISLAKAAGAAISSLASSLPARFTASDRIPGIPTTWSLARVAELTDGNLALAELIQLELGEVESIDTTDGVRTTFSSGEIVHLRPSGNAPELRCYVEADDASEAQALCQKVLANIHAYYQRSAVKTSETLASEFRL